MAAGFLIAAFALPFLHSEFALEIPSWIPAWVADRTRDWLIDHGRIPVGDHYLGSTIGKLFAAREYFVGAALLLFSIIFPIAKISACAFLGLAGARISSGARRRIRTILAAAGKWSMADVFVVAFVVVLFKADGFQYEFVAKSGIYCYAVSAILSAAAVHFLESDP